VLYSSNLSVQPEILMAVTANKVAARYDFICFMFYILLIRTINLSSNLSDVLKVVRKTPYQLKCL
jgi:hypothetical protein